MAALTTTTSNKLLDHLLATTAWTKPTAVYLALCTTAPTASAGGTEISTVGTGYARQAVAFSAAASAATANSGTVTFPTATANWGTISHWELWDAVTGGSRLAYGAWTASKIIQTGDVFVVPAGQLTVSGS